MTSDLRTAFMYQSGTLAAEIRVSVPVRKERLKRLVALLKNKANA